MKLTPFGEIMYATSNDTFQRCSLAMMEFGVLAAVRDALEMDSLSAAWPAVIGEAGDQP